MKLKRKDIGKVDIGIWNFSEGFFWRKNEKMPIHSSSRLTQIVTVQNFSFRVYICLAFLKPKYTKVDLFNLLLLFGLSSLWRLWPFLKLLFDEYGLFNLKNLATLLFFSNELHHSFHTSIAYMAISERCTKLNQNIKIFFISTYFFLQSVSQI